MKRHGIELREGWPTLTGIPALLRHHPGAWMVHLAWMTDSANHGVELSHGLFDWEVAGPHALLQGRGER